jgi:ribosomal protein L11 methyltransferase
VLSWRKIVSAKWEDEWLESLSFLEQRLAVFTFPNRRTIRLEAFSLTPSEGKQLVKQFGGQLREIKTARLIQQQPKRLIKVRNRLIITASERQFKTARAQYPERTVLFIPAGMAFGTGDHATTSACLRLLTDACRGQKEWGFLDLGTGSGILAIAASKLGARKVEACDFDPAAVRITRENAEANDVSNLRAVKRDVMKWQPKTKWRIVAANIYSGILIRSAAAISDAVETGGMLILSGIMRDQEPDVADAFTRRGFTTMKRVHRGKWVAMLARKIKVAA